MTELYLVLEEEAAVFANVLTTQLQKTPVSELHNIKYDSFFCYGFICLMPFSLFFFSFLALSLVLFDSYWSSKWSLV